MQSVILIQVDLTAVGVITGIQTQGGEGQDKMITAFKVRAGSEPCMDYIKDSNGIPKVSWTMRLKWQHSWMCWLWFGIIMRNAFKKSENIDGIGSVICEIAVKIAEMWESEKTFGQ